MEVTMTFDRHMIVQALVDAQAEAATLLSMGTEKSFELIKVVAVNALAVIGLGVISLVAFIGFLFGSVELGDLIPID
jgi:hypothetical protein